MADEILKLMVKLGGDWNKLEKIRENGLNVKANLKLSGDFNKLNKLTSGGLDIKVNLKLGGDFNKLVNLASKGITIKSSVGGSQGAPSFRPTNQQQFNANQVKEYNQYSKEDTAARREQSNRFLKDFFAVQEKNFQARQQSQKAEAGKALQGAIRSSTQAAASNSPLNYIAQKEGQIKDQVAFNATRKALNDKEIAADKKAAADRQAIRNKTTAAAQQSFNSSFNSEFSKTAPAGVSAPTTRSFTASYDPKLAGQSISEVQEQANQNAITLQRQRSTQRRNFNRQARLDEANRLFSRSSTFSNEEETKRSLALRFGITPGDINSKRKLFDIQRLRDPENLREIAFAGLFGQGIAGKAAGVAGASIGGALGPGGAFFGGTVAQIGIEAASHAFEKLGETLKSASDAGVEFERAVSATAGSLGVYTEVFSKSTGQTVTGP